MSDNEIVLEGAMTIAKAEALHHELEKRLHDAPKLTINATQVERADTSIIQLLASLSETANKEGITVSIAASEGLRECAGILGFAKLSERFV